MQMMLEARLGLPFKSVRPERLASDLPFRRARSNLPFKGKGRVFSSRGSFLTGLKGEYFLSLGLKRLSLDQTLLIFIYVNIS